MKKPNERKKNEKTMTKEERKDFTKEVKDTVKEVAIDKTEGLKEVDEKTQAEMAEILLTESVKPVVLKNKDFKIAPQEPDIRKLSKANKDQIIFRLLSTNVTLTRQLTQIENSNYQLIMLLAKKLGIDPKQLGKELETLKAEIREGVKLEQDKLKKEKKSQA